MIVAVVAAATLIPPSREALIERWLHANPRHRVEWLASPPARPAPKTIDLRALAQRELSIDGRYNLTTAQAKAPEPWWRQALKWIADWWNNLWRSIAKRAHIAPRTANDLGYVVLALVGLTLLVVGVRLARNIRLSRSERGAQGEPLAASPDPQALYEQARDFANRGEYGNAALRLFAAAVALLTRRGAVVADPSATVGDLRAALRRKHATFVPAFDAVAAPFVQTAYAERPIDASQWHRAADAFTLLND
ncbi:MAG: hypothetical protein JO263_11725 [Candidatus Eremiobacteraeota bacterium]|nr:hypothetical protein [Candidatus Eremiobacteraeota bacterium]